MFHDSYFDINKLQVGQEVWVRKYASVEYNGNIAAYGWRAKHYDGGVDINRLGEWQKLPVSSIYVATKKDKNYVNKKYINKPYSFVVGNEVLSMGEHASEGAFEVGRDWFIQVSTVEPPSRDLEEQEALQECNELIGSLIDSITSNLEKNEEIYTC